MILLPKRHHDIFMHQASVCTSIMVGCHSNNQVLCSSNILDPKCACQCDVGHQSCVLPGAHAHLNGGCPTHMHTIVQVCMCVIGAHVVQMCSALGNMHDWWQESIMIIIWNHDHASFMQQGLVHTNIMFFLFLQQQSG